MTSANVIEYRIERDGKVVGYFRKHLLCKLPGYSDLLKYEPLSEHEITPCGYDEDEDYWEDDPINLEKYLRQMTRTNKTISEYFDKYDL